MKNILEERKVSSDVLWAFRKVEPVRTYDYVNFLSKNLDALSEDVLNLVTSISQYLSEVSNEEDQESRLRIKALMDEIRCSYSPTFIRFLAIAFSKLLKHFYSGVYINEEAVDKIKTVIGNSPVIFVPSHRSYCDFIIMAYTCFAVDLEIPCVAAAIDFSSMKMIGSLLRDCKAFFIRRNFHNDPLYKSIFQRYLQYLTVKGNSPVEFFIEGTRSRTGKALTPKFGLLKTIVDTYIENDVPDIIVIPIGISYDRVVEDMLFSYELLGIPKPPESTMGFFKALATMDENYGNIFINFGEPMYLRSYLMKHNLSSWPTESAAILEKLGYQIIKEQQKLQKILCINLLCLILHDQYMKKESITISVPSAVMLILNLKNFLEALGAAVYLSDNLEKCVHETLHIHKSFFHFSKKDNKIFLKTISADPTYSHKKTKSKGAKLNSGILKESVSILRLQQYINPLLCLIAAPAFVVLLVQCILPYNTILRKFKFLNNLFFNEFILMEDNEELVLIRSLKQLVYFNVIKEENQSFVINKSNWLSYVLSCALLPFILSYESTCSILKDCTEEHDLESITEKVQLLIQDKLSKGLLSHHASLSLDTIYQALNFLLQEQVILKIKRNDCDRYRIKNYSLLRDIHSELECLMKYHTITWNENSETLKSLIGSKL